MGIYAKLGAIQQKLKASKNQYNKFGNFYYRNCEDIQEALKPLLQESGAVLVLEDNIVERGGRVYVEATATLCDIEKECSVSVRAYAREEEQLKGMVAAQITGSASSYARKYALNGLFCIDDSKDPDYTNDKMDNQDKGKKQPERNTKVSKNQIAVVRKEIERTGAKEAAVCYQYRIKTLDEMTIEQFKNAMEIFKSMPDIPGKAPEVPDIPDDIETPFN